MPVKVEAPEATAPYPVKAEAAPAVAPAAAAVPVATPAAATLWAPVKRNEQKIGVQIDQF